MWSIAAYSRWIRPSLFHAAIALAVWCGVLAILIVAAGMLAKSTRPRGWTWLLGPMHSLLIAASWLGRERLRREAAATAADARVELPAGMAESAGAIGEDAVEEAADGVVELRETTLAEVRVPRSEIEALADTARARDWLALARASGHGRIPVYRDDLDDIRGYLATTDLYREIDANAPIATFVRPIRFVPESMRGDDLLREMIVQGESLAIVVDEFGGTAGLVTSQDLLEILLGEIEQEHASLGPWKTGELSYQADGAARIDDLNETLRIELPEGDYETLAGLILARLGRIPAPGERVVVNDIALAVTAVSRRRIQRVGLTLPGAHERADSREEPEARRGDRRG
jgi:putative hemolysin